MAVHPSWPTQALWPRPALRERRAAELGHCPLPVFPLSRANLPPCRTHCEDVGPAFGLFADGGGGVGGCDGLDPQFPLADAGCGGHRGRVVAEGPTPVGSLSTIEQAMSCGIPGRLPNPGPVFCLNKTSPPNPAKNPCSSPPTSVTWPGQPLCPPLLRVVEVGTLTLILIAHPQGPCCFPRVPPQILRQRESMASPRSPLPTLGRRPWDSCLGHRKLPRQSSPTQTLWCPSRSHGAPLLDHTPGRGGRPRPTQQPKGNRVPKESEWESKAPGGWHLLGAERIPRS